MFGRLLSDYAASEVVPFDGAAATIHETLKGQRVRIGSMDLRIASIALARGLILVTRNVRDFQRIPGLSTENWTTGGQSNGPSSS
ncbi:type II toxin-antitoxin system VapC family toxin [Aquisphaera giovannonii]|uniref:type II toxin-antitoxin system VapC family toxin n=1 Tax=Aquisphaera giovannonii TaxID=406548 RepID=UPI0011E06CB2|nr:type II toxin-antitoxin system VapC family toxin [Aquisphaera giovannonii]